jgi:hypothetical protein
MPKNYVTSDEKEFKIPHINLAYNHEMVRSAVILLKRIFLLDALLQLIY